MIAKAIDHLRTHRFLAVVGVSGSGKSSLVRVGVVAALALGQDAPLFDNSLLPTGSSDWPIHVITPTARLLESLAASLTRNVESVTATATLIEDLKTEASSLHLYLRTSPIGRQGEQSTPLASCGSI